MGVVLPVLLLGLVIYLTVRAIKKYGKSNMNAMSNGRHLESARYADYNKKHMNYPGMIK